MWTTRLILEHRVLTKVMEDPHFHLKSVQASMQTAYPMFGVLELDPMYHPVDPREVEAAEKKGLLLSYSNIPENGPVKQCVSLWTFRYETVCANHQDAMELAQNVTIMFPQTFASVQVVTNMSTEMLGDVQ